MRHSVLVILETHAPSPPCRLPANTRPQMAEPPRAASPHRPSPPSPAPPLQEKQGPYFLRLQAGFRSLCPLIYQRTAVLRLCDDQSPAPSVSLSQSRLYPPHPSHPTLPPAPYSPGNLLLSHFLRFPHLHLTPPSPTPIPTHPPPSFPPVSVLHSLLSVQIPLAAPPSLCCSQQTRTGPGNHVPVLVNRRELDTRRPRYKRSS